MDVAVFQIKLSLQKYAVNPGYGLMTLSGHSSEWSATILKKKKKLPRSVRNIEADMEIIIVLKQYKYQHKTSIYMAEK